MTEVEPVGPFWEAEPEHQDYLQRYPNGCSGATMMMVADDVQTLVIPGAAHWVAEQAPDQVLAALTMFLIP